MARFERANRDGGVLNILIGSGVPRGYITAMGCVVWTKPAMEISITLEDQKQIIEKCEEVVGVLTKFDE